jgi:DNA uptake protein ComE-like DNA-binding protein
VKSALIKHPWTAQAISCGISLGILLCSAGCANTATTILATSAGVGLGVPLATQSHVDVKVELYRDDTENHGSFLDKNSALRQKVQDCLDERKAKEVMKNAKALYGQLNSINLDTAEDHAAPADKPKVKSMKLVKAALSEAMTSGTQPNLTQVDPELRSFTNLNTASAATVSALGGSSAVESLANSARQLLDTTISPGLLGDEVTQVVLTKDGLNEVIDPKNSKNWQPFAHAHSSGGAGNHNAVIYFENMGWPVLKSSVFNPSKFTEAFGKTFQVAFKSLATAYGVPVAGDAAGKDVQGLDAFSSAFNQKAAESKSAAAKAKLLDTLDTITKLQSGVKPPPSTQPLDSSAATTLLSGLKTLANDLQNADLSK